MQCWTAIQYDLIPGLKGMLRTWPTVGRPPRMIAFALANAYDKMQASGHRKMEMMKVYDVAKAKVKQTRD
ncbi:hypothetical protein [Methyloglobulus sp.]|uniref:hypothetical protein n=1 Tax=Methyloglobulus sp. TaxID=2518622 RepID=UPI003989A88C